MKTAYIILVLPSSMRGKRVRVFQCCFGFTCSMAFSFQKPVDQLDRPSVIKFHAKLPNFTGWKCCKPRVLTFDEFLSIPPCTTGKHSTTDVPPQIEKTQSSEVPDVQAAPETAPAPSRAPIAAPQTVPTPPPPAPESENDDPSLDIPDGKTCRRRTCGAQYKAGQSREGEKCVYHPGVPIFHEGSKGYTCCKRRVLEFDEFMRIEGCETKDRHLFIGSGKKKGEAKENEKGEEILETVR